MGGKSGGGGRDCVLGVLKEEVEGISTDAEAPALLGSRLGVLIFDVSRSRKEVVLVLGVTKPLSVLSLV